MCVLPNVWLCFSQNVTFYKVTTQNSACRRPPFLQPGMGAIVGFVFGSVLAKLFNVFVRFNVSWGDPKGRHFRAILIKMQYHRTSKNAYSY